MSEEIKNFTVDPVKAIEELIAELQSRPHGQDADDVMERAYQTTALMGGGGYIYVLVSSMKDKNIIKIGRTKNLQERVSQLTSQVGTLMPFTASLGMAVITDDDSQAEAELHEEFKEFRLRGEWFDVPSLIDVYRAVMQRAYPPVHFIDLEAMRTTDEEIRKFRSRPLSKNEQGYEAMSYVMGLVGEVCSHVPEDANQIFSAASEWWSERLDEERTLAGLKTYKELSDESQERQLENPPAMDLVQ